MLKTTLTKTISLFTLVMVTATFSFPSLVYSQLLIEDDTQEGSSVNGIEFRTTSSQQPTQEQRDAMSEILDALEAENPQNVQAGGQESPEVDAILLNSATSCLTQLAALKLVDLFGFLFDEALASLEEKVLELAFPKVPVQDDNLADLIKLSNSKYVGTSNFFGAVGLPAKNALFWCVLNVVLEEVLVATTEWVNTGFEGNPAFVDDPEQFFRDVADYEAGRVLSELSNDFLCSPFSVNVRIGLLKRYTRLNNSSCTLSEIGENFQGFIDGEFGEDGWKKWFQLTQTPQNTPTGAFLLASDLLFTRISAERGAVNVELGWNSGWLSTKDFANGTGETITPGHITQQAFSDITGIPYDRLALADEFDQLITALFNQLIKVSLDEVLQ
jgi:hypothetical protein